MTQSDEDGRSQTHESRVEPHRGCGTILVGFDGSTASHDALEYATGLARRTGKNLVVVHVANDAWEHLGESYGAVALPPADADPRPELAREVGELMACGGLAWRYVTARGSVAYELERAAAATHADVLIIGRSRRGCHAIRPSIASTLARRSKRIVTVVP